MNPFTFAACLPEGLDKFAAGNLIALETHGRGGPEMRNNHNVRCRTCAPWALPCRCWLAAPTAVGACFI